MLAFYTHKLSFGGTGVEGSIGFDPSQSDEVEERVVEKVVVKDTGISEEDLKRAEEQARIEAQQFAMMSEEEKQRALQAKVRASS